jgi:hypothetical protein
MDNRGVFLMVVLGAILLTGVALALRWAGTPYRSWTPRPPGEQDDAKMGVPPLRETALRYLRGVAVGLAAGFWTGALITGPAVRLIMRLLAVTGGDDAQGRITEANEVVGEITAEGTLGLIMFGGILPAMLSGAIYFAARPWLPDGRVGGLVFGALHLIVAATRIDPLRPDNVDFDLVGPGWLSALTFGATALVHGMAIAAFANRFSAVFPPTTADRRGWARAWAPLVLPALLVVPLAFALIPVAVGLVLALVGSRIEGARRLARSPRVLLAGRAVMALVALLFLPGAVSDLRDVVIR